MVLRYNSTHGTHITRLHKACRHGFVTAAPEIYGRIEPPGTVIAFDDAGRTRGIEDAAKMPVAHFDEDARSIFGLAPPRWPEEN